MFSSVNLNKDNRSFVSAAVHTATEYRPVHWQDRANKRFKCEFPIIYKYFNSETDEFTMGDGIAYNYSLNGMYFETTNPIPPNSPVYIEAQKDSLSALGFDVDEGHHAEVKWCRRKDSEFGSYNIGVQLYEPLTHGNERIILSHCYQ